MFVLSSYLAHAISDIYKSIANSGASDAAKIEIANTVKAAELVAARFAESLKLQRERIKAEERKRKKMESEAEKNEQEN